MGHLIAMSSPKRRLVAVALVVALGLSLVSTSGCVFIHRGRACVPLAGIIFVAAAPPALVIETRPPRPTSVAVWIDGYWSWDGHAYVWIPGFWERHPRSCCWVPGHWNKRHRGWVWTPGHWK